LSTKPRPKNRTSDGHGEISAAEVKEEDEGYTSILDELFNALEQRNPDHLALKQYRIFKMAAGKTAKSILISLGVRLEKFNLRKSQAW
jgi:type IV secretion system protein VirD4